jgi:hypothetical protein
MPDSNYSSNNEAFAAFDNRSGIDYALRTLQQNQVQFSQMADTKANIMITVCSIVISASLTQIDRPMFLAPLLTLDFFTAIALVAALLCVLPSRSTPKRRRGGVDVQSPTFNPLFFMHFRHLPMDAFEREIAARFADSAALYQSLVRDIYAQGVVLANTKYRYLRISYLAFIAGFIAGLTVTALQLAKVSRFL